MAYRATRKEREEFVALIMQHVDSPEGWDAKFSLAQRLMRYGATYAGIQERACNGHQDWQGNWDEAAAKRDELKEERLEARITKLCKEFDCVPEFQGDPRGATIKIKVSDGFTNDWGHVGICVPGS